MPTLQHKRGTTAALQAVNPTPLAGEIVWDSTTNTLRVGDGTSAYTSLSVISAAPTAHTHGNITNAGAIGSTANLPVITTTSGVLTTGSFSTTAGTFCEGNDSRLSDTRTPTDGSVTTAKIANDAVTYAKIQNVSATDRLLGRSSVGAGDVEEITCTAFGRSLIGSADAASARTTLSVQPTASPAFTGAATVTNDGNVVPLTVTNTGTANSFVVNDESGDASPFVISNAGNVGIGAAPGTTLDIQRASADAAVFVQGQTSSTGATVQMYSGAGIAYIGTRTNHPLVITTNNAERVKIEAAGAVIVTSPLTLTGTVAGNVRALKLQTSGVDRWQITPGFDAESGSDAGSTFWITRWSDAGAFLGTPIAISRATGSVTLENPLFVQAGSASACGVAFSGDPNTGLAQIGGADTASLVTAGNERLRVTDSRVFINGNGEQYGFGVRYVSTGGAVHFGATSNSATPDAAISNAGGGTLLLAKNNGEVIVGGTTDQGAYNLQCNGTGVWGAGAYVNGSDKRIKDEIAPIGEATNVITAMQPVTFRYKPTWSSDRSIQPGFVAQQLQEALAGTPYLDGVVQQGTEYLSVAYQSLIPLLVKALQESNARIAALEERLNHA